MNVKGLKTTDILNIDLDTFNKLSESELRAITSRLVSASNKRIRRLEKHDINSPALQGLGKQKTFSTKLPKDTAKQQRVNQLRSEFARSRSFLTSETSTISGYKAFAKRTRKRIASELHMTEKQVEQSLDLNRLYDILHKAQQRGIISSYRGSKGSVQARNQIAEILIENPNIDEDYLLDYFEENVDAYYEQEELEDETEEFDLWQIWIN